MACVLVNKGFLSLLLGEYVTSWPDTAFPKLCILTTRPYSHGEDTAH